MIIFFFKQKTAYELESRDWSSDVCSSDLTTYLIDESGVIVRAFDKVKAADNPAQMLVELG